MSSAASEGVQLQSFTIDPWNGGGDGPTMIEGLEPLLENMKEPFRLLNEFSKE